MLTSLVYVVRRAVRRFVADDTAGSAVEYAAVVGLGALAAVSSSRALTQQLAHTMDTIAAVLHTVGP